MFYINTEIKFSIITKTDGDFNTSHLPKISTTVANKSRLLCLVTTQPANHATKALAVKETWGKACDILYFVSSEMVPELPAIRVQCEKYDHDHLLCKNIKAILYGLNKYRNQFDWFFKADDDTFVIVDNLRQLLDKHNPDTAIWFGCPFALGGNRNKTYPSGGAGYAMSRQSMYLMENALKNHTKCRFLNLKNRETGADDAEIGICLNELGAQIGDETDDRHLKRFFPFPPNTFIDKTTGFYEWFNVYNVNPVQKGLNCCSNTTISFHYVPSNDMYIYDFLLITNNQIQLKSCLNNLNIMFGDQRDVLGRHRFIPFSLQYLSNHNSNINNTGTNEYKSVFILF
ncbi:glycoprotein-N-acetylgalactosamine 3-beta-galactosyltransferase 1-like [Oppia nitens]|uniref:glycoprotein-N-acetylgalactosamine 3-beta-galactosyltransferase 1-like n=1 Tax=Oppia nitens TaxID=1686743 RepID=UPI0023D9BE73|nr:glycoprotein-N-acetylgalactosamine 3-beta-galactosyltransferase 1-like [Oppia nitens]